MTVAERNRYLNGVRTLFADPTNPYGKMIATHGEELCRLQLADKSL